MPKFKPARPPLPRSRVVSAGAPRLLAPVRALAPVKPGTRLLAPVRATIPTQRRVQVRPILPPKPKLRNVLRPNVRPLAPATGPTQRPLPRPAMPGVLRKGPRPVAPMTERAVAQKLVRPVTPPVVRLRNVLRPIAKPLAVVPSVKVSRATVVAPVQPPVSAVRVVEAPSQVPVIMPPAPTVRMGLKTSAPLMDGQPYQMIRYATPAAADYFAAQEYDAALGGQSHGFLRLVRSQYAGARARRGYGYSESTGFPTIKMGATDEASGGAVTYVRARLAASAWYRDPSTSTALRNATVNDPDFSTFTSNLRDAVMSFQKYNGLSPDGVVGKGTYKALGYTGSVASGSSSQGAAPSTQRGGSSPSPTPAPGEGEEAGFSFSTLTQQVWFWPAAILVPTAGIIAGILLWPSKKAPAAAPVASKTLVPA
jgi:hypothetical protein